MKLCECGCGEPAPIARVTNRRQDSVKGEPQRFVLGHANRLSPVEYLEEDRGHSTPCWIWQKSITKSTGYGWEAKSRQTAHRYMYIKHKGPIPTGMDPDHLCRVRACCNPHHLEAVTRAENARRSPLIGRAPKLHARSLTDDQVRMIRASTLSNVALGKYLGVSHTCVRNVRNKVYYKEVA